MINNRRLPIIIAALMLLLQSATLVHAVEHAYVDHTEICKLYSTAEKLGAIEFATSILISSANSASQIFYSNQEYFHLTTSPYSSRAPPLV